MTAPSVQSIIRTGLRYFFGEIQFRDFSGGLNIRDAAPELAANESPDLWNVTLDERGSIGKRLGLSKYNLVPLDETAVTLTTAGTPTFNGDSSCTINGVGTDNVDLTVPKTLGLLDPTQGWMAVRLKLPTSQDVADRPALWWRQSGNEIIQLDRIANTKDWRARRWTGGAGNDVTVTGGEADAALLTLVIAWTATTLKLSVSGGAFSSVANTTVPLTLDDTLFIGSNHIPNSWLIADFHWAALGTGTLTDANAATIHAQGNTDPSPVNLPGSCKAVWPATSTAVWTGRVLTTAGDYWASGQNQITQAGKGLFQDTTTTPFKTFTTSATCAMADYKGKLIIVHPIDGLFSYDGATVTAIGAGPKGNCIAAWQNKLWVSGDPSAKSRVYFSGPGDETSWPGTSFVDLREKDQEAVTCLAGSSGVDISGRPGLLAAKRRSTYRIYDSSTGAFQTLDTEVGCASAQSFTNGFQRTVFLGEAGIYWTDGVGPMRPASDKLAPLFDPVMLNFSKLDLWRAGSKGDRMYFSLCRAGSTANDLELEYHPLQGWIVANSCAASFYTTYRKNDQILYAGSPTANGQVYARFSGGSDDGTPITSRWQERWVELSSGHPARVGRVRIAGRGLFTAELFKDYEPTVSESFTVDLRGSAAVYDDAGAVYDQAGVLYGPVKFQDAQDYAMNEVVKAFSLRFTETSSGTSAGLQILGAGTTPIIGSWGAYGLNYTYRPLGLG